MPEHEVADTGFAAGADKQVGLGGFGQGKALGEVFFSDFAFSFSNQLISSLQDIPAAAVIGSHGEREAGVVGGEPFGGFDAGHNGGGEAAAVADYFEPQVVLVHFGHLPV